MTPGGINAAETTSVLKHIHSQVNRITAQLKINIDDKISVKVHIFLKNADLGGNIIIGGNY